MPVVRDIKRGLALWTISGLEKTAGMEQLERVLEEMEALEMALLILPESSYKQAPFSFLVTLRGSGEKICIYFPKNFPSAAPQLLFRSPLGTKMESPVCFERYLDGFRYRLKLDNWTSSSSLVNYVNTLVQAEDGIKDNSIGPTTPTCLLLTPDILFLLATLD